MEGKGHRFTADLVQVGRSPVTAKERAEWLRLDALARSRKYGPVAESADDLDALAALIAEAELAEAVGPVVPGRWVTLKDGRRVYIKDKAMPDASVAGTVQSTLGAEPAPTPVALTAPTAAPSGSVWDRVVPVPAGLKNAKTTDEINAWFKENYQGAVNVNFTGASPTLARDVAIAYNDLATKFEPITRERNLIITVGECSTPNTMAEASPDRITLSKKYFKSPKKLRDTVIRNEATGFHPKGVTDPASVFVHEYGHVVKHALDRNGSGTFTGYTVNGKGQIHRALGDFYEIKGRSGISEYAVKGINSDSETFAEAFVVNHYRAPAMTHPIAQFQRNLLEMTIEAAGAGYLDPDRDLGAIHDLAPYARAREEERIETALRRLKRGTT